MRTIAELAAALRSRTLSSVELAQQALDCVAAAQPHLNAFITVDEPGALASARAADAALARGDAAALTGIPLAHKDVLMTQGLRTTCGSRMLEHFVAPYDADVVARLRNAGASTVFIIVWPVLPSLPATGTTCCSARATSAGTSAPSDGVKLT